MRHPKMRFANATVALLFIVCLSGVMAMRNKITKEETEDHKLIAAEQETAAAASDFTIRLQSKPTMCFNAKGNTLQRGDVIQLFMCSANRNERFIWAPDGTIRVQEKPDMCLTVAGNTFVSGSAIQLYECSAQDNGRFEARSDGTIRLRANPELCLNAKSSALEQGNIIQLYTCSAAPNERFTFGSASPVPPSPSPRPPSTSPSPVPPSPSTSPRPPTPSPSPVPPSTRPPSPSPSPMPGGGGYNYSTYVAIDRRYTMTNPMFVGCGYSYEDHWYKITPTQVRSLQGKVVNNRDGSCNDYGVMAYQALTYGGAQAKGGKPDSNEWCKTKCRLQGRSRPTKPWDCEQTARRRIAIWDKGADPPKDFAQCEDCAGMRPQCWLRVEDKYMNLPLEKMNEALKARAKALASDVFARNYQRYNNFDMTKIHDQFKNGGDGCLPLNRGICAEGWRECRGMCYSTVTRNSYGAFHHDNEQGFAEFRCMTCQGARLALINQKDTKMLDFGQAIFTDRDSQADSDDEHREKGFWIRQNLFLTEPIQSKHGQPWMYFIKESVDNEDKRADESTLKAEGPKQTYGRVVRDGSGRPVFDYTKLEGNLLCVQHAEVLRGRNKKEECMNGQDNYMKWSDAMTYPQPGA